MALVSPGVTVTTTDEVYVSLSSSRFIRSLTVNGRPQVLICDYNWWMANKDKLEIWLALHTEDGLLTQQGMVLSFKDEKELMWFMMRWQ